MICLTSLFSGKALSLSILKNAIKSVSQRDYPFFPTDLNSTVLNRALWWKTVLFLKQNLGKFTSERATRPGKWLFGKKKEENKVKKEKRKRAISSKSSPDKTILLKVIMKSPFTPAKLTLLTLCWIYGVPRVLKPPHLGWARNPDHTSVSPSLTAPGSAGTGSAPSRCEVPAVPPWQKEGSEKQTKWA